MTTNQLPASANARRLKFSARFLIGISALVIGVLLIFAENRSVPVSPIASHSTLRVRNTGLRSEHSDEAAQSVSYDLWAHPTFPTNLASTDDANNVKRALERDHETFTLPVNPATKSVLEYLRTHPIVETAPKSES